MSITTIGLLSPGDMGHSIGAVLHNNGLRVLTCLTGRSERSRALAAEAGIEDVPSLEELVEAADVFLSVLVPAVALETATKVADALRATGADLFYVDCNAIAPRTVREVGEVVSCGRRTGGRHRHHRRATAPARHTLLCLRPRRRRGGSVGRTTAWTCASSATRWARRPA